MQLVTGVEWGEVKVAIKQVYWHKNKSVEFSRVVQAIPKQRGQISKTFAVMS